MSNINELFEVYADRLYGLKDIELIKDILLDFTTEILMEVK